MPVGMAIAERTLAAQFNRAGLDIVNHYTYASVGDGCLMEGISHEACSLAGTLGLGKLIVIYDSNRISIDGEVEGWFTEDVPQRLDAYRWHVIPDVDGHNPDAVAQALSAARAVTDKPSILCCNTIIGLGSPNKQGKASSHGAPLGTEEVALARETIGWSWPEFEIPDEIYRGWDARQRGEELEAAWNEKFSAYEKRYPEDAAEFKRRVKGELPENWQETCRTYIEATRQKAESIASRKASQNALNAYGPALPELVGGSADLTGSNLTLRQDSAVISDAGCGRQLPLLRRQGVRHGRHQ